jgi:hypothetical protein
MTNDDSAAVRKEPDDAATETMDDTESTAEIQVDDTEAVSEDTQVEENATVQREQDGARMRRIGSLHFAAVMAALTLWGAGDAWASQSGMALAFIVSLGNALIAGFVIASIAHEWGHFSGARLAGSISPVLEQPVRYFFMFNFNMEKNSVGQFLSMSTGGPLANWLLVLLFLVLIPVDTASRALIIATVAGIAVNVSLFEVPIILRVRNSGEPQQELARQLASPGLQTLPGIVVGGIVWLLLL